EPRRSPRKSSDCDARSSVAGTRLRRDSNPAPLFDEGWQQQRPPGWVVFVAFGLASLRSFLSVVSAYRPHATDLSPAHPSRLLLRGLAIDPVPACSIPPGFAGELMGGRQFRFRPFKCGIDWVTC